MIKRPEEGACDSAMHLLVLSARVSPPLIAALRIVEAELRYLDAALHLEREAHAVTKTSLAGCITANKALGRRINELAPVRSEGRTDG